MYFWNNFLKNFAIKRILLFIAYCNIANTHFIKKYFFINFGEVIFYFFYFFFSILSFSKITSYKS